MSPINTGVEEKLHTKPSNSNYKLTNGNTHYYFSTTRTIISLPDANSEKDKNMLDVSECFPDLKRSRNKKKRRFSDEQIRSLEVIFESDTKVDPRRKIEVAKELGLQPRQVATWFQNKRARSKSNQIEKDYSLLFHKYNNLASQFDSLNKHKHLLTIQLQNLKDQIAGNCQVNNEGQIQETAESDNAKIDSEVMKNIDIDSNSLDVSDDEGSYIMEELLGQNHQDWGSLDSHDLIINQPTHDQSYQWWDFWN